MGIIYKQAAATDDNTKADISSLGQYAKWFVLHNLSFSLRNDGGTWVCEALGRHGDLPFSARSNRCGSSEQADYECFVSARNTLRGEPYIMG
jgi:hypothetical protein